MSFENKEVMIPNKEFITSALTNWSLTSTVTKLEFIVGVAYDADVERAKSLLLSIVNSTRQSVQSNDISYSSLSFKQQNNTRDEISEDFLKTEA